MKKCHEAIIKRLKKAGISEDVLKDFASLTDRSEKELNAISEQLLLGASVKDALVQQSECPELVFGGEIVCISYVGLGKKEIKVKASENLSYHDTLDFVLSYPCSFPREVLLSLYRLGMPEDNIRKIYSVYSKNKDGKFLIESDKDENERGISRWPETRLVFSAVMYLYSNGADTDILKSLVPYFARYEKNLLRRHRIYRSNRAKSTGYPGLISQINNERQDKSSIFDRGTSFDIPELLSVVKADAMHPERIKRALEGETDKKSLFPDFSKAFADKDGHLKDEFMETSVSSEFAAIFRTAAEKIKGAPKAITVRFPSAVISYDRYYNAPEGKGENTIVTISIYSSTTIDWRGNITSVPIWGTRDEQVDIQLLFFPNGKAFIEWKKSPYAKNIHIRPLTLSDIAEIYYRYMSEWPRTCRRLMDMLFSKEAGTALYDIGKEIVERISGDGRYIKLPPLR
ncbi:MAG: hypothetical protein ACI4CS_11880 [Candidatus Weimeria sp.]